jgi:hypothetical protein
MAMRRKLIGFLLLSSAGLIGAQHTSTWQNTAWLVRIYERELTTHPTGGPNNAGECLVVTTDGRIHLELRRQEFFDGRATLATYEGKLNSKQLDDFRTILDSGAIRSLPQFVMATVPMPVDSFHAVTATISRSSGIQGIGYFEWQGEAPANAASAGQNWLLSAASMKPLVEWFHTVKGIYPWKRVANPKSGVCGDLLRPEM